MARKLRSLAVLALVGAISACTSGGQGYQDNPAARKFTWFSYIKGEDLQSNCRPGAPDSYRFVYNGIYVEQVRSYDIEPAPDPKLARMTTRVTEKANLSNMELDMAHPDVFGPWRPKTAVIDLPASEIARLKQSLLASGFLTRPPPSRGVSSIEFYWAVSACLDGQFHLNAYVWPDAEFEQASFPKLLFAWDMTEVPVNKPRHADVMQVYNGISENDPYKLPNLFKLRFD